MHSTPDPERTLGDVVRYGVIERVAYDPPRVVVRVADLRTAEILWGSPRWGRFRVFIPPAEGEQVALVCPEGDIAAATVAYSLPCAAFPSGPGDERLRIEHDDGFVLEYRPADQVLRLAPPAGGRTEIAGDLQVHGKLSTDGDVVAGATVDPISLLGHDHLGVKAGTDRSLGPV